MPPSPPGQERPGRLCRPWAWLVGCVRVSEPVAGCVRVGDRKRVRRAARARSVMDGEGQMHGRNPGRLPSSGLLGSPPQHGQVCEDNRVVEWVWQPRRPVHVRAGWACVAVGAHRACMLASLRVPPVIRRMHGSLCSWWCMMVPRCQGAAGQGRAARARRALVLGVCGAARRAVCARAHLVGRRAERVVEQRALCSSTKTLSREASTRNQQR